jgi:hypothetical protein
LPVDREIAQAQRHVDGAAAGQINRRLVAVVARIEHDDLVAVAHGGGDRREQRLGRTAGHGHLGACVHAAAVHAFGLQRDLFAQLGHPGHRRILILRRIHGLCQRIAQCLRAVEIRKALAQVHGLVLDCELRHDREDRRADLGQFSLKVHHASRIWMAKRMSMVARPA